MDKWIPQKANTIFLLKLLIDDIYVTVFYGLFIKMWLILWNILNLVRIINADMISQQIWLLYSPNILSYFPRRKKIKICESMLLHKTMVLGHQTSDLLLSTRKSILSTTPMIMTSLTLEVKKHEIMILAYWALEIPKNTLLLSLNVI